MRLDSSNVAFSDCVRKQTANLGAKHTCIASHASDLLCNPISIKQHNLQAAVSVYLDAPVRFLKTVETVMGVSHVRLSIKTNWVSIYVHHEAELLWYRGNSEHKQRWFCMGSVSRLNAPPEYTLDTSWTFRTVVLLLPPYHGVFKEAPPA